MGCYVYKFLGADDEVLYIGKTKRLKNRLEKQHFTLNGHLGVEVYESTERVVVADVVNSEALSIYERYLINTEKPKYNVVSNKGMVMGFSLPELDWQEVKINRDRIRNQMYKRLENAGSKEEILKRKEKIVMEKMNEEAINMGWVSREVVDIRAEEGRTKEDYKIIKYENAPIYSLGIQRIRYWERDRDLIPYCRAITVNGKKYFCIADIDFIEGMAHHDSNGSRKMIMLGLIQSEDVLLLDDKTLLDRKHRNSRTALRFGSETWLARKITESVRLNKKRWNNNSKWGKDGWSSEIGYLAKLILEDKR